MCGVCGIFGIEDKSLIEKMVLVLKHRGPDDQGIYTDTNFSMGHARLSIIDLSERGRQPMSNENGDIWLSVNGEIYNFQELRASLEKNGHIFHSNSDSEVIIHSFEQYGLDFVKKLRGMFALGLYDKKNHRLILARDPIGKKPLYYFFDGKILVFASEIKAILAAGIKPKINMQSLSAYLAYQYSLGEHTLFDGIKKVLAGNILILQDNNLIVQKYWDIQETIIQADEEFFRTKLRSLLEESTKLRMVADVPIGAFLSGGLDSSAVVALARPHVETKFHTFSVGFETFSELEYAKIVSEHLDTTHHEQIITDKMVMSELGRIAWIFDEPLGDAAIINNYFLSKVAKKYVTVVLAGEGGDEIFAGYPNYFYNTTAKKILRYNMLTLFYDKILTCISNITVINDHYRMKTILKYAHYFSDENVENFHQNTTRTMSDHELHESFTLPEFNINSLAIYPKNIKTLLNRMLAMDCKNLLPEKYLMKSDKGTMANSIEQRLPLLDKYVIEFAFSIPPSLKLKNNSEKYIFKKSVQDLLPKRIIKRKKQGFGTTVGHWMENELGDIVTQKLDHGELLSRIFKQNEKNKLLSDVKKSMREQPSKTWTLFALELWYETFFKNQRLSCENFNH
jgi:asparagine synthase (glutamine-hydrolysing)